MMMVFSQSDSPLLVVVISNSFAGNDGTFTASLGVRQLIYSAPGEDDERNALDPRNAS